MNEENKMNIYANIPVYMQTKRNETLPFDFRCVYLLLFI